MIKSLREVAIQNCDDDEELNLHECVIDLDEEDRKP
jgi:hypothetical protein